MLSMLKKHLKSLSYDIDRTEKELSIARGTCDEGAIKVKLNNLHNEKILLVNEIKLLEIQNKKEKKIVC